MVHGSSKGEGGRVVHLHGGRGDLSPVLASATFTVTDGDGDTATATVSFQVTDANMPTAGTASAAVDDDGLSGPPAGNPASTTGDLNANLAGDGNASEAVFTRRAGRQRWA